MLVPMAIVLWMMLAIHMGAIAIVFVLRRFFFVVGVVRYATLTYQPTQ